jgi:hypothetical protein
VARGEQNIRASHGVYGGFSQFSRRVSAVYTIEGSRLTRQRKWVYEAKFREWNFRKKLWGADWRIIGDILKKRKLEDKDSDVFDHGILIPPKKVQKEIVRKRAHPSGTTGKKAD